MRPHIRYFVSQFARMLPCPGPVYEFGSYLVPTQRWLADMRPLFPGREYVGCDMRPGPGVDRVLDITKASWSQEASTVLCLETLEHVARPAAAVWVAWYALRPGGVLLMTSTMDCGIHRHPLDYWRFTPDGFNELLEPFKPKRLVRFCGDPTFPHTVIGLGVKGDLPPGWRVFQNWLDGWCGSQHEPWLKRAVRAWCPPLVWRWAVKFRVWG